MDQNILLLSNKLKNASCQISTPFDLLHANVGSFNYRPPREGYMATGLEVFNIFNPVN